MIITTNITMDLSRRGPTQVISAVQDDRYSRNIAMALTCGSVAWEPPEGTTVQVRYRKPDGTGGSYDTLPDGTPAWTIDGSTLTIALAPQVCTVPGRVTLTAALVQGETQLHTFVVGIDVQPNPGLQVTSENYYKIAGALPDSGWEPDLYLGTDSEGKVVTKTAPAGGLTLLGAVRPGQYLRVESVDENGNITLEAVYLNGKLVAVLCNGVRVPPLPELTGNYLSLNVIGDYCRVIASNKPFVWDGKAAYNLSNAIVQQAYHTFDVDEGWRFYNPEPDEIDSMNIYDTISWTNYDLALEDGSVLRASEPVPVYE